MADFNPDPDEFEGILKDSKKGGAREAGRMLASVYAQGLDMAEFKALAEKGKMPDAVEEWLSAREIQKGDRKKIRNGFRSRISELLDSLERSKSWEGFTGLSEEERWAEIRKR